MKIWFFHDERMLLMNKWCTLLSFQANLFLNFFIHLCFDYFQSGKAALKEIYSRIIKKTLIFLTFILFDKERRWKDDKKIIKTTKMSSFDASPSFLPYFKRLLHFFHQIVIFGKDIFISNPLFFKKLLQYYLDQKQC